MNSLAEAIQHLQSGNLHAAELACCGILDVDPGNADALHILGAIALQVGNTAACIELVRQAVQGDHASPVFLNTLGIGYSRAGRTQDAITAFGQALQLSPEFPEALNNLGNVLKDAGRLDDSIGCYKRALAASPNYADALNNLGEALTTLGRLPEAVRAIEHAIELRPGFAGALYNLGRALQRMGRTVEAITEYERALQLRPTYVEAHNNLGSAIQQAGDVERAIGCFRRAVELAPTYPEALNNLGNALHLSGELSEAEAILQRALAEQANFAEAHSNLGNVYRDQGYFERARLSYETALSIRPDLAEAHNNLGNVLVYEKKTAEALASYETAIGLKPEYADAHHNLGNALYEQGRVDDSRQSFDQAILLKPQKVLWKLRRNAISPWVFEDGGAIDRFREQLERTLDELWEQSPKLSVRDIFTSACEPAFALNFHGRSNLAIKQKYARLFGRAVPSFEAKFGSGRPRVGFIVTRGHEGIFLRSMKGLINRLSPGVFRLFAIASVSALPRINREITHSDVEFVGIPEHLESAVDVIRGLQCDLLYHWEISSDVINYLLALYRLAPIQCTSWGIQDTSGAPTIDWYLSSALLEADGNQRHYSERLGLMKTLPSYQYRSPAPAERHDRSRYGLDDKDHLYLCAQNLMKFHPDFDPLLAEILRRDRLGKVVITQGKDQAHVAEQLRARMATAMPADRIVFLSRQKGADYLNLIRSADVMLDPPHFCGVNTTYDGFSMGTPIVAFPTEFQRTRYTAGCYQKMRVGDLVASSSDEYVQIAVRIGTDPCYREAMKSRIDERSQILFEDHASVEEHEQFFLRTIEEGRASS